MKKLICAVLLALLLASAAQAGDAAGIRVETLAKTGSSWDGTRLPAYPTGQPEITILRITVPAGAVLPLHTHPVINAGVLLSGELTVVTEKEENLVLKAGDPIVEVVNKRHYGKNTGAGPAEIVVFYAGSPETPISIKQ